MPTKTVNFLSGRRGDPRPIQRCHHLQPEPGAAEGDAIAGRQLHVRGVQRRGGPGLQASHCHHHV